MVLTDDYLVAVRLERDDEILRNGQQSITSPGVVLDLTAMAQDDGFGNHLRLNPFFAPDEARTLAETLLRLADLAETETGEAVW